MTGIAASTSSDNGLAKLLRQIGQMTAANAKPAASAAGANAVTDETHSATTVDLSDHAKAVLEKAKADLAAALDIPDSLDELVQRRTDALAQKLTEAFTKAGIPADEVVTLQVDRAGNVHASGPYKERIEKFFEENPEAAKEFKAVAGLNALRAAAEALRLYNEEKKSATSDKGRTAALDRYTERSMHIQALSGVMTLEKGKLTSASVDYAASLSGPIQTPQHLGTDVLA